MRRLLTILSLLPIVFILSCSDNDEKENVEFIGNPTAEDFLDESDADIFVLDDIVFTNAEEVDWVLELDYELGEKVGEISKHAEAAADFDNEAANRLPIGTEIYQTNTEAFIAVVEGKEIRYLPMIEG